MDKLRHATEMAKSPDEKISTLTNPLTEAPFPSQIEGIIIVEVHNVYEERPQLPHPNRIYSPCAAVWKRTEKVP